MADTRTPEEQAWSKQVIKLMLSGYELHGPVKFATIIKDYTEACLHHFKQKSKKEVKSIEEAKSIAAQL